jgi:DNA-directed RNA polymerase specialized sigma subunit
MTAKEYLNQAYWLDRRIDSKLEQLSALKDMATKTTSIMSDDVVSHTRNVHSMQDVIAKIIDMQAEINADIDRLVDLKRDIMQVVKTVDDPELQTLLELRYLCFKDWPDIACEMHCSESNVYKVHSRALQAVRVPKLDSKLQ